MSAAQAMTALFRNSVPLSKLCRRRHNFDYADLWVMPTLDSGMALPGGDSGPARSA